MTKSSTASGQLDIWSAFGSLTFGQMYSPGRGIEWPRVVLCEVRLTFGQPLGQADLSSDVLPW